MRDYRTMAKVPLHLAFWGAFLAVGHIMISVGDVRDWARRRREETRR